MNAEQLALCVSEEGFDHLFGSYLVFLARNNPKALCEVGKELSRQERANQNPLLKCPRGRALKVAWEEACRDSTEAPTLREVKAAFIAKYGKKKWNGGHDEEESLGNWSARKTLKILGYPLAKGKVGRRKGSKSPRLSGLQGLAKAIVKK